MSFSFINAALMLAISPISATELGRSVAALPHSKPGQELSPVGEPVTVQPLQQSTAPKSGDGATGYSRISAQRSSFKLSVSMRWLRLPIVRSSSR
jgi:hypothetical protein